jgi:hypothetical protein
MIPAEAIVHTVAGRGITGSIETVLVRHVSGKKSKLGFKTYEQGRRAFEGEAKDFVWCDEEPPMDIYTEILYRLLTTKGPLLDNLYAIVRHERSGDELSGTGE